MDNKVLLEKILKKEGVNEAFHALSKKFNIKDISHLRRNWSEVEQLLLKFTVKRYSISSDFLFRETIIQPFKDADEIQIIKQHLLN